MGTYIFRQTRYTKTYRNTYGFNIIENFESLGIFFIQITKFMGILNMYITILIGS